ncbi:MAG: flippase [Candidatus Omnitrophota bacterium]
MHTQKISHRIIRSTVFSILGRLWGILVALFLTPYIIKHIGVERYGVWALAGVLTGYFGLLDLGIGYAFSKYIAEFYAKKDYDQINTIVNTGFVFYSIFASVIIIVAFLKIDFLVGIFKSPAYLHQEIAFVFLVAVVIFGFFNMFSAFFAVQAGLQRMDITNKIVMVASIPMVAGTVFFLKNGYGLPGLMVNNAMVFLFSSVLNFISVFRLLPQLKFNLFLFSLNTFKKLFGFGFKIQVSRFAGLFHFQMDKFLLAYFLDVGFVAFYSVASQTASKLIELPMMFVSALQPAASELDAKMDRDRLIELYFRSMKYVILSALPICLVTVLLARPFIILWLGKGYGYSVPTLQLLISIYFINLLTGPGFCILNGIGKPEYGMKSSTLAALLNVILSVILVIKIGYFGVVYGTVSAMLIAAIYFIFMFHRASKIPFWDFAAKIFLKPVLAGGLSVLILSIFMNDKLLSNWIGLLAFGAIYLVLFVGLIWLMRYIDAYDRLLINRYAQLKIFKSGG